MELKQAMNIRFAIPLAICALVSLVGSAGAQTFDEGWRFTRVEDASTPQQPPVDAVWEQVTLPHTTRIEPRVVNDQWQGIAFYEKRFTPAADWQGQRVLLRVEAAMNNAEIVLNDRRIGDHRGGYLPFTLDLTDHLVAGENRLLLRLDNRDDPLTGPKPLKDLDFNTYGGLYRGVKLMVRPPVYLSDEMLENRVAGGGLFVTYPEVSQDSATIALAADIRNTTSAAATATVRHQLYHGEHLAGSSEATVQLAADALTRSQQSITVPQPRLWSPRTPELYRLVTTISADGRDDVTETTLGIRTLEITTDGFRINGERMQLRGVNRHQEYPYVGYALSPQAEYRDAKLIKEAGFDYVRLSHYPHSPAFMDAADRLGLVVLDAIPGWQYINPDPAFRAQVVQTCRDMIRRDRNRPSVIGWECSLNETEMPVDLVQEFHDVVHQEYPGPQAWSAGWQDDGYDIYLQARQHRLKHYTPPERPYVVSEYGDWEYYAENAGFNQTDWADLKGEERTSRQALGSGETRLLQQATNVQEAMNDNLSTPAFADGYWAMFDYNRGYADDLELSGTMSIERNPKFAWWFFRSQRDPGETSELHASGPMVKIASYWQPESNPVVRVFSNAEEVELLLNGRSLGRQAPQRDRLSERLPHPPFHFDTGAFAAGTLVARAFIGGRQVAEDQVVTPGTQAALTVEIAAEGVPVTPGDLVFARARLADDAGNPVPASDVPVRFAVDGGWEIVGPAQVTTEAGIASVLLRAPASLVSGTIFAQTAALPVAEASLPGSR